VLAVPEPIPTKAFINAAFSSRVSTYGIGPRAAPRFSIA
jgi:hypothetical protein